LIHIFNTDIVTDSFFLTFQPVCYVPPEGCSVLGDTGVPLAEQLSASNNSLPKHTESLTRKPPNPKRHRTASATETLSSFVALPWLLYPPLLLIWRKQIYTSGRVDVRRRAHFAVSAFDLVGRFSYTLITLKGKQLQTLQFLRIDINNMADTGAHYDR